MKVRRLSGSVVNNNGTMIKCPLFCREVHHGGLGKEGDSVPRLRGEKGSTEEDPGWCFAHRCMNVGAAKKKKCCLVRKSSKPAPTGGAAGCGLGRPRASGDVARRRPPVCRQCRLSPDRSQEGPGLEQRGGPAGHQRAHQRPGAGALLEVSMTLF